MPANGLIFKDAVKARDAITATQKKEIAGLYTNWAKEVEAKAMKYNNKENASAPISSFQMKQLQRQLEATSKNVMNEVQGNIVENMYLMADNVVQSNNLWLKSLGIMPKNFNVSFTTVSDPTIRRILTGQVYESGWSLSKSIWGDNETTLKDIYSVVAKGIAQNVPIADIAKQLESYVNPNKQMRWNKIAKDGVKIYKQKVDYCSQRLARTLVQHSYQQTVLSVTKDNPFVTAYKWNSNGSRVCELCKARDGMIFDKNSLPMDHPNGMCTIEPVISPTMKEDLAKWFSSDDGVFPEIDKFAENFGYKVIPKPSITDEKAFIDKVGMSKKTQASWYNGLSKADQATAKLLKTQSGKTWEKWYADTIFDGVVDVEESMLEKEFLTKYGYSKSKLPDNFADWSHALTSADKTKIFKMLDIVDDAHPFQKINTWYDEQIKLIKKQVKNEPKEKVVAKVVNTKYDEVMAVLKNSSHVNVDDILNYTGSKLYDQLKVSELEKLGEILGVKWDDSAHAALQIIKDAAKTTTKLDDVLAILESNPNIDKSKLLQYTAEGLQDLLSISQSEKLAALTGGKWYDAAEDALNIIKSSGAKKEVTKKLAEKIDDKVKSVIAKFDDITQARRDKALWFKKAKEADAYLRPKSGEVWRSLNATQKNGLYQYTAGSGFMNRPLRGYDQRWSNFKGIGKVSLNNERADGEKLINAMINAINKSSYDDDIWLQRGVNREGAEAFLGLPSGTIRRSSQEELEQMLLGKVVTDEAFLSTGVAKGSGFSGDIFNVFAPKGTKMAYAEPFSHFGDGAKLGWDGISTQSSIGYEAEMIIQRGTSFVITKVEKSGSNLFFDMDVIAQK